MSEIATVVPPEATPASTGRADGSIVIPPISTLDEFRAWCLSDDYPEKARVAYFRGQLEIDVAGQTVGDHGEVIIAIVVALSTLVREHDLGSLTDQLTRVSLPTADLSCEPDVVFVSHESLESGRVAETPKANRPEVGVEFVGPPDLIVEVVSDSSFDKDFRRFREAYEEAGVGEYWVVDARGEKAVFELLRHDGKRFVASAVDEDGWRRSPLFDKEFRLTVRPGRGGRRIWTLESRS